MDPSFEDRLRQVRARAARREWPPVTFESQVERLTRRSNPTRARRGEARPGDRFAVLLERVRRRAGRRR